MKKISLLTVTAIAAMGLNIATLGSTVFAADGDTATTATPTTTNGTINLTTQKGDDGKTDKDITLDSAPNIDFGEHNIDTSAQTYTAENIDTPIQVTNPGVNSGWTVTVAASEFKGDNSHTLKGAVLTIGKGTVSTAEANQSTAPTAIAVTTNSSAQTIFSAADGNTGVGVWQSMPDKTTTTLAVPAGNVAGSYKADLTWTLTNAPQN
jgi:hypothetical protein